MRYLNGQLVEALPGDDEAPAADQVIVRREVPLQAVIARLMVLEAIPAVLAVLEQSHEAKAKFLSLHEGIYADDEDARAVFTAAGVDPDVILA